MKELIFTRVITKEKLCLITMLDELIDDINSIDYDDQISFHKDAICISQALDDLWVFFGDHYGNEARLELKNLTLRLKNSICSSFASDFEILQSLYLCVLTLEDIKIRVTTPKVKFSKKLRKALNDFAIEGGQSNDD